MGRWWARAIALWWLCSVNAAQGQDTTVVDDETLTPVPEVPTPPEVEDAVIDQEVEDVVTDQAAEFVVIDGDKTHPRSRVAPEREGTAVIAVNADMAVIDGDETYSSTVFGGGLSLVILGRPAAWPVSIGLMAGFTAFGGTQHAGPWVLHGGSGGVALTSTTVHRSIEWRHVAAVARVQPFWGLVRPFVDVAFGMAVLWHTIHLESASGRSLRAAEEQRSVAAYGSLTIGIDWRLYNYGPAGCGSGAWLLSTGVRRWYTTSMERPGYFVQDDTIAVHDIRAPLSVWMPFVGLSFSFDSRPNAQALHHGPGGGACFESEPTDPSDDKRFVVPHDES